MKHILLVCTGNTCRSSMAEGILKNIIENDNELNGSFTVSSAGVFACSGEPASKQAVEALKIKWGIDIGSHRAKQLTREGIISADLILTMTQAHKSSVAAMFPEAENKTYVLKEYVVFDNKAIRRNHFDIIDPYGSPVHVYEKCAEEIRGVLEGLVLKLKRTL